MEHLADTTLEDLQNALDSVEEKKPAQRLIAAIAYKQGVTQSELATWFDVERKTIYNWLNRLDAADLGSAARDERRPGRPRKLQPDQQEQLQAILQDPPTMVGYDAPAWTTDLLRDFIRDRFDIDYSRPSCRRLMKESGLRYQPADYTSIESTFDGTHGDDQERTFPDYVWVPDE